MDARQKDQEGPRPPLRVRRIRRPVAFVVAVLLVLVVAGLVLDVCGLPLLDGRPFGCGQGTGSFGCTSSFGTFGLWWLFGLMLALWVAWKAYGDMSVK